jgi:hypothetical protein
MENEALQITRHVNLEPRMITKFLNMAIVDNKVVFM